MNAQLPATLCARQPIFDKSLEIYAYELLFRGEDTEFASVGDGDRASSQVLLNAFSQIPYESLLEGRKGFVNFTRQLLKSCPPVSEEVVVIEILEDVVVDPDMVADVKALKSSGFTIALDDYVYDPNHHELLELTDIIKIDVLSKNTARVACELEQLRDYDVTFLAEKIEAKSDFERCRDLGFSLFQGYFLSKPNVVKGKKINADQRSVIRLLNVLQDRNAEFDDIQKAISSSAALTYNLLKLINSSAFTFQGKISSIQQAVTLLGLEKIRTWGSLLALSQMPDKPSVLASSALIRAQLCKQLAQKLTLESREDSLFTVGLLSNMDAFLDLPMKKIVDSLGLPSWVEETLLLRSGNMGLILNTAIHYEQCAFEQVDFSRLRQLDISACDVQEAYQTSILWASDIMCEFRP